jgi:hypothetical protein
MQVLSCWFGRGKIGRSCRRFAANPGGEPSRASVPDLVRFDVGRRQRKPVSPARRPQALPDKPAGTRRHPA